MYKSTFMGLNTALRGVLAHQNALDVTGHNIANLETEGYSRQRAEMKTAPAWSTAAWNSQVAPGQMGTGVEVTYLERLRDQYVDANVRQQLGRQGTQQALVEQLQQLEGVFQEPGDSSISKLINNFWSKMDAVANDPDDNDFAARNAFAQAAQELTAAFQQVDADLTAVQAQSNLRLNDTVSQINTIASRIAAINTEVRNAISRGQQPNDLLDTRDLLMDDLSKLVNFTSTANVNGEVTITMGATFGNLVDPSVAGGANVVARTDLDDMYAAGEMTGGRALADEQLWDPTGAAGSAGTGIIDSVRDSLNTWVNTFVTSMNAANVAGFDLNGNAGVALFQGTTAATFALNTANNMLTNPRLIAAASSWTGPGEPANGRNFQNILNAIRPMPQGALGSVSFDEHYSAVISSLGARAAAADRNLENAEVLVSMAQSRRTQVSGVSLDEEMSNMLRFQHAYNASARVMTTIDESLDTIINRMGRVGL